MKFCKSASLLVALAVSALSSMHAWAETYEVKMLNRNSTGPMPYEPDFLKLKPGDKIKFRATMPSHNAASIESMKPAGAKSFKGKINEEITVEFTEKGFYGIQCIPHVNMGMVMLVQVGEEGNLDDVKIEPSLPPIAQKRFKDIIARTKAAAK